MATSNTAKCRTILQALNYGWVPCNEIYAHALRRHVEHFVMGGVLACDLLSMVVAEYDDALAIVEEYEDDVPPNAGSAS